MLMLLAAFLGAEDDATVSEPDVQALVQAAKEGDSHAARRLYRLYVARVFRTVRPLSASDAEAEDLVQDTFIKALGSLQRYEPRTDTRFAAWLLTIGLNTARKRTRRRDRESLVAPERLDALRDADAAGTFDPSHDAEELRGQRAAVLEALAELPERDRQIICLRYGADLDAAEVGRICQVTAENVRKICERQRHHLLQRLSEAPATPPATESRR